MQFLIKTFVPVITIFFCSINFTLADSKRVLVYDFSQNYWDVKPGETLGIITSVLMPKQPEKRKQLMQDIVAQNPHAFLNNDINKMLSYTRLMLPNFSREPIQQKPKNTKNVEQYSWGHVKRVK